jgi:hypothetical protein
MTGIAASLPTDGWILALAAWVVGGFLVGLVVACRFAYAVAHAVGTRSQAVVGGTLRGVLAGFAWPALLLAWVVRGLSKGRRRRR